MKFRQRLIVGVPILTFCVTVFAQEQNKELDDVQVIRSNAANASTMEEMVVTEVQEQIRTAFTFEDFRNVRDRGEYYYLTRQYKKAFPYLLASAKRGYKTAQARVAYIYMNGLGVVQPSVTTGIGWLGVAASPRSDPEIKNHFKEVMGNVPEHLQERLEIVIADFIERYGADATGMDCLHVRTAGTHVSTLECNFEAEFDVRDALFQDWLSTGFGGIGPFSTGYGSSDPSGQASPNAGGGGGGGG